jgi:GNAT superfamily N-acetyltransferase
MPGRPSQSSEENSVNENNYEISTDRSRLDLAMIHDFLANRSYWAAGIPVPVVKKSVENALCFGVYHQDRQVGFARVVTDYATTAYLGDVFILESYRGKGLGKRLVETIMGHPELQGLRFWLLGTKDAHGLYEKHGFQKVTEMPLRERLMAIRNTDVYKQR